MKIHNRKPDINNLYKVLRCERPDRPTLIEGKHSFEDTIKPVEDFYEEWAGKIAVLGGVDMDFIMRSTEGEIAARGRAMIERAWSRGGYALGAGNSVPEFIPDGKFLALLKTALEY